MQWVQASDRNARLRIQTEITNLEPSSTFRHRTPFSSYASQGVPQGYTHKGQVLGASIGPGASSQWLALDRLASHRFASLRITSFFGIASLHIESIVGFASAAHRIESHHIYDLKPLTQKKKERVRKNKGSGDTNTRHYGLSQNQYT